MRATIDGIRFLSVEIMSVVVVGAAAAAGLAVRGADSERGPWAGTAVRWCLMPLRLECPGRLGLEVGATVLRVSDVWQ